MKKEINPASIIIYEQTATWNFLLFTITAFNILIFEKRQAQILRRSHFKSEEDFIAMAELQSRLNSLTDSMLLLKSDESQNAFSEFSLNDISFMLILIDSVAKYLLNLDNTTSSRPLIEELTVATGIKPDWEKSFFIEAQLFFKEMKVALKPFPKIIDAIMNYEK